MYLKKSRVKGNLYYQAVETDQGKQRVIEHLGTLETMIKHKRMATGKTLYNDEGKSD